LTVDRHDDRARRAWRATPWQRQGACAAKRPQQALISPAHDRAPRPDLRRAAAHESPGHRGLGIADDEGTGFADLVLLRLRFGDVLSLEQTGALTSGAADILERARIVDGLSETLDGVQHGCTTAMTPADAGPTARGLRLRLALLRHEQRRCLPLPRLPEHSQRAALPAG
jgi:hypothetical protein